MSVRADKEFVSVCPAKSKIKCHTCNTLLSDPSGLGINIAFKSVNTICIKPSPLRL